MSDKCERLFSSAKILLEDRRSRLRIDIVEANELLRHSYGPPPQGAFDDDDVEVVEGVEERDKMVLLDEYKLAQEVILLSLAAAEQEAIRAEDDAEQAAVAAGEKPLEETLAAIEVDDDALSEVIPLEDSDNPEEEDEEDEEDELEEQYS